MIQPECNVTILMSMGTDFEVGTSWLLCFSGPFRELGVDNSSEVIIAEVINTG